MPQDFHPGNPVNDATEKQHLSFSHFNINRVVLGTHRFADVTPILGLEVVPDDKKAEFTSPHNLRSYTLKSPLMQDLTMRKEYGFVPLQVILPFNSEKIIVQPNHGDDVDPYDAGCAVKNFRGKLNAYLLAVKTYVTGFRSTSSVSQGILNKFMDILIFTERFVSSGSILASLNCHLDSMCPDFDDYFDSVISNLALLALAGKLKFRVPNSAGGNTDYQLTDPTAPEYMSFHDALGYLRDYSSSTHFLIVGDWSAVSGSSISPVFPDIVFNNYPSTYTEDYSINFGVVWAYQFYCKHYLSNDHVDYIYSAELFRQYLSSIIYADLSNFDTFLYNGVTTQYDSTSAHYIGYFLDKMTSAIVNGTSLPISSLDYFSVLLNFNRSLRYEDYFTGAKTQPLAVGNNNIAVVGGNVSVVDTTKAIQWQRFRNAVERTGRKISKYIESLFPGVNMRSDMHDPLWLASVDCKVYTPEVENTGSAQVSQAQSVTSMFRSAESQYIFTTDIDRYGFIIGVCYYDIKRVYTQGIERMFSHADRFDMFNPMLQYIGDQDISEIELNGSRPNNPFGYTLRYMEFKQLPNYAYGGFIKEYIPGFAFTYVPIPYASGRPLNISPDFIRSNNGELDRFYTSLTGYSLGHYFHFIVMLENKLSINRPMSYAPSIL